MTSPSPHPTEQLSSLLTPGENPGSFREVDFLDIASWPVPPVSDEDKRSDTYLHSHMQGLEDCLNRLDQRMQRIESLMSQLLEAMADEDEQDEPRTYMDGSPV